MIDIKDVIKELKETERSEHDLYYEGYIETQSYKIEEKENIGGEGEGEYYSTIFKVTNENSDCIFIQWDAYYDSNNGCDPYDFDSINETQKTINIEEVWGSVNHRNLTEEEITQGILDLKNAFSLAVVGDYKINLIK